MADLARAIDSVFVATRHGRATKLFMAFHASAKAAMGPNGAHWSGSHSASNSVPGSLERACRTLFLLLRHKKSGDALVLLLPMSPEGAGRGPSARLAVIGSD